MKYLILQTTPPSGRGPIKVNLEDERGKTLKFVTAWPRDWDIRDLIPGNSIFANIRSEIKNGYTNLTLDKDSAPERRSPSQPFKPQMAEVMEVKSQNIAKAQENKEAAIILSSTFRDATLMTVVQMGDNDMGVLQESDMKSIWKKWRAWLLDEYSKDQRRAMTNPVVDNYGSYESNDDVINPEDIPF